MSLAATSGRTDYAAYVERTTADLHARATTDDMGTRWTQAEHRVRPELLQAQTGLMQGAAGMGLYFLHLRPFPSTFTSVHRVTGFPVQVGLITKRSAHEG